MSKHLWEIEHPYYCTVDNYFGYSGENPSDFHDKYESFGEFLNEYKDSDMDMNLIFRWDWKPLQYGEGIEMKPIWSKDKYYRDGELTIFWMMQRKGFHRTTTVKVCKADEPKVIEFLQPRLKHLLKLWEPLELLK